MTKDWRNTWEETPIYFTDKHAAISMTLRDYFAGLAMQGMISREGGMLRRTPDFVAVKSYEYADAMLAEREKNRDPR